MGLTEAEQRVLAWLPEKTFFSTREVAAAVGRRVRRPYLVELLDRLVAKKALLRVKRGAYYRGSVADAGFRYKTGCAYAEGKAYVAFATALHYHGFTDQQPTAYFYATEKKRLRATLYGTDYFFQPLRAHYYGAVQAHGFSVSSKAKTIYDCLLKPTLVGGERTITEALRQQGLSRNEWLELLAFLTTTGSNRMRQRAGYLLEKNHAAPEWFLKKLLKATETTSSIAVLGRGEFNKKWGVYGSG